MERKKILGLDKFEPDKELQNKYKLSEVEELILKPHIKGVECLTKDEIIEYLKIDIDTLVHKTSRKLITICRETQKELKDNLEELLSNNKKEEEIDNER